MEKRKMNENFKKYYLCVLISNVGNACTTFVLPLFILEITNSPFHLSMISAIKLVPFLVLGLPFGAIVDKVNKKKLMQICDLIRFINYVILFVVSISGNKILMVFVIYVCEIISGGCYVFHSISENTIIPLIAKKNEFTKANSLIFASQYVTNFFVPLAAGALYLNSRAGLFFLFDAVSFLISAVLLMKVKVSEEIDNKKAFVKLHFSEILKDVREGVGLLKLDLPLLKVLIIITLSNLIISSFDNALLDYMKNTLSFPVRQIGMISGVYSLGAILATSILGITTKKINSLQMITICIVLDALLRISISFGKSPFGITALMFLLEMISAVLNITLITMRQETVDIRYLGRINSVFKTVLLGINPIGLVIGGTIMSQIGSFNTMKLISYLSILLALIAVIVLKKGEISNTKE